MSLLELSAQDFGYLAGIMYIGYFVIIVATIANIVYRLKSWNTVLSGFLLMVATLNLALLLELNHIFIEPIDYLSKYAVFISEMPYAFQLIFFAVKMLFSGYTLFSVYQGSKKELGITSVKEAIENLPSGLAFYDERGFLFLSNKRIQKLSLLLTKKDLQNAVELQNDLQGLQNEQFCVIKGSEPAFRLSDGRIWRFSESNLETDGWGYKMLRADDITEYYEVGEKINFANEKLVEEKKRLHDHIENIQNYISEEETLRLRMMSHDDFGELITLTVNAFEKKTTAQERLQLISLWGGLNKRLKKFFADTEKRRYSLDTVKNLAERLNCKVVINGKLPVGDNAEIIFYALYESLKNAVYHVGAREVVASIVQGDEELSVTIFNRDEKKSEEVIEGGGLTSLRDKVKSVGATMKTYRKDGFYTELRF